MADPINGPSQISTLIRAQTQAPINALKNNQDTSQTLQLQKTAVPAKATGVTLTSKTLGLPQNLPRGSIVDFTV